MKKTITSNNSSKNIDYNETSKNNSIKKIKKHTVLVWLDFGPYAYFNFGIISALSKLDDFDFIGIITTKKDISFFENQNIIKFKKIFYYPECYINKTSYNLQKLKTYEKKYDLNLWLDIYSERSFHKYWIDFHKFSKDEILAIIEHSISFFQKILDDFEPYLILMQQPGENVSNLLLYKIAKKTGVLTLTPNLIYMHNKIVISDNIDCREISKRFKTLMEKPTTLSQSYNEQFLQNHSLSKSMDVISSFNYDTMNISEKISYYVKRMWNESEPIYMNKGKTKFRMLKNKYQNYFKIKNRKNFLDFHSIKTIEDKKFLYFPLQSEPEAIVLIKSSFFSNTVNLVESIAKSIPIDTILYVKEHPIQKEKSWRSIETYQKIIDIPNVKLIHPNVNSQELISKSQAVICLSGATGFEAQFYKKPVILFSNEYYDVLSMIKKVNKLTELPNTINDAINNYQFHNDELHAIIQASDNESINVPYFSILKDGITLSSIQKNDNLQLTLENFQKFYNTYKKYFSLIAKTINSKL